MTNLQTYPTHISFLKGNYNFVMFTWNVMSLFIVSGLLPAVELG